MSKRKLPLFDDALIAEGLKMQEKLNALYLATPLVKKALAFSKGKPKGAAGRMRKFVQKMLTRKANRALTTRELWEACKALPERQRDRIEFGSMDAWVADHGNVSFRRFANIVSEEKKLLR